MREQHPESSVVNTSTTITAANDNGSSGSNSSKTEKNTSATTGTSTSTTSNVNIEEADKADTNDDDDSHSSYDAADMHNYFTRIDEGDDEEDKKGADDTSSNGGDDDDDEKNKSDTNADSDSHDLNHIKHKIGYKETKDVLILRLISFSVLLLSTCLVAFCVNYYVRSNEYAKFKYQFKQNTHKVLESLNKKVDDTFASIDIFSSNIVAYVQSTNQTWPYITIPNFPILAAKTRSISLGIFLETANLVAPDQRMDWEDFAWEHRQWVNESLIVQQTDENYYGPCIWNTTADPSIYGDFGPIPYTENRRYMPNWHMYPAIPIWDQNFNWDWLTDDNLPEATLKIIDEHVAIISEPYMLYDRSIPEEKELNDILIGWFEYFIRPDENPNEPCSDIMFPVLADLSHIRIVDEERDGPAVNHTVVAGIRSPFYWRDTIKYILPEGNTGMIVVFNNPCSPSFTYQINGPNVVYLGKGDLHDPQYDDLKIETGFFGLSSYAIQASEYTGPPIDTNYCPMTIAAYPSDEMKSQFCTRNPILFTCIVVFIFIFTSFVFAWYDYKVERRQNVVLTSAVKSNAIVSSLFPSHIRDKLMDEQPELDAPKEHPAAETKNTTTTGQKTPMDGEENNVNYQIKSFLDTDGLPTAFVDTCEETDLLIVPEPIADIYEETTVMVATITGFMSWSFHRDPKHIFILLEILHGEFDKLAKKKDILKVESIKDAYVCAVGIPEYRKHHAITMARFASIILGKMPALTKRLEAAVGRESASLDLSIGISSGQTIAGVLRCAKTRFQLFGTAMSEAEILERTGAPGRIHCSYTTASLLISAGKGLWLKRCEYDSYGASNQLSPEARTETYWVNVVRANKSVRSGGSTHESSETSISNDFCDLASPNKLRRSVNHQASRRDSHHSVASLSRRESAISTTSSIGPEITRPTKIDAPKLLLGSRGASALSFDHGVQPNYVSPAPQTPIGSSHPKYSKDSMQKQLQQQPSPHYSNQIRLTPTVAAASPELQCKPNSINRHHQTTVQQQNDPISRSIKQQPDRQYVVPSNNGRQPKSPMSIEQPHKSPSSVRSHHQRNYDNSHDRFHPVAAQPTILLSNNEQPVPIRPIVNPYDRSSTMVMDTAVPPPTTPRTQTRRPVHQPSPSSSRFHEHDHSSYGQPASFTDLERQQQRLNHHQSYQSSSLPSRSVLNEEISRYRSPSSKNGNNNYYHNKNSVTSLAPIGGVVDGRLYDDYDTNHYSNNNIETYDFYHEDNGRGVGGEYYDGKYQSDSVDNNYYYNENDNSNRDYPHRNDRRHQQHYQHHQPEPESHPISNRQPQHAASGVTGYNDNIRAWINKDLSNKSGGRLGI